MPNFSSSSILSISPQLRREARAVVPVKDLRTILTSKNEDEINNAVSNLVKSGAPAVSELLRISRAATESQIDRIANALIKFGEPFIPEIEKGLKSKNENERFAAAASLGILYPDERIRGFASTLNKPSATLVEKEIAAIILAPRARISDLESIMDAFPKADPDQSRHLILALGAIGHKEQRDFVVSLANTGSQYNKIDAIESLSLSVGSAPLEELQTLALNHKEAAIRRLAIQGLASRSSELDGRHSIHSETVLNLERFVSNKSNSTAGRKEALDLLIKILDAKNSPLGRIRLRDDIEAKNLNTADNQSLTDILNTLLN